MKTKTQNRIKKLQLIIENIINWKIKVKNKNLILDWLNLILIRLEVEGAYIQDNLNLQFTN